jgi:Tol biopolymer transport system component
MPSWSAYRRFSIGVFFFFCLSLSFTDAGVAQPIFEDVTQKTLVSSGARLIFSNSTAFGDYDNDGWPDLFMTGGSQVALLHNDGNGRFADALGEVEAEISPQNKGGGSIFGDYDNDGDLDIYMTVGRFTPGADRDVLLRNDRGVFRDVGLEAGLNQELASDNAIWLDYDRDGDLDLYVANLYFGGRNKLYRNQGDGTFADVTAAAGLDVEMGPGGGSNGGLAAGDFDNDGWPDLYVGVYQAPNRLFLQDGDGAFVEATPGDIADVGESFAVAAGDIDNDGDLDLFQASGGGGNEGFRSLMFLNLGGGEFLDVTEGVGLNELAETSVLTASLGDLDNDGDLDLLTGRPHFLFLNRGDGAFEDHTDQSGMPQEAIGGALGDYDLDGFLDLVDGFGVAFSGATLYRNKGNDHHWLRVELVGLESNRNGIGARLIAKVGGQQQMRELLGGWGFSQDELVVHFGLGESRQVDKLEIHWPSGRVEVLENVPADQKIRVFEGQGLYHKVEATRWEAINLPEAAVVGTAFDLDLEVQPMLFAPEAQITRVFADLSAFGGLPEEPLTAQDDGTYDLQQRLEVVGSNGLKTLPVFIEQSTFIGPYWVRLERTLMAFPRNESLFGTGPADPWQLGLDEGGVPEVELYQGTEAVALDSPVEAVLRPEQSVPLFGYQALRFRFHPGEARQLPRPNDADASDILYVSQIQDDTESYGRSEIFGMRADGTRAVNLSNDPWEESLADSDGPSWSPDGTRIAFTSRRGHAVDIYVMDADGSNPVNLTQHPAFDSSPSWSPDGARIAFSSDRDLPEPFSGNPDNPSLFGRFAGNVLTDADIYVMDADGAGVVRLTDAPGLDHFAAWSPDGSQIAFASNRDREPETGEPNFEIYVMDADGSNPVRLTNAPGRDISPAWSPDGQRIAFSSERDGGICDIYVMDADGSNPVNLTHYPSCDLAPSWSPDGQRIAFCSWRGGLQIVAMDPDGSNQIQLTHGPNAGWPTWSPVAGSTHMHFAVAINGGRIIRLVVRDLADIGVDLERREWQEVTIPLADFWLEKPIEEVRFLSNLAGAAYLYDIQLIAASPSPVTTVLEEHTAAPPQSFALTQNYPNPFNSNTVIGFNLPRSQDVELTVYNLAGQKVVSLVNGYRQAGSYTMHWDGRDEAGRALASGVYLYRLQAGTRVETRKLLLLR